MAGELGFRCGLEINTIYTYRPVLDLAGTSVASPRGV